MFKKSLLILTLIVAPVQLVKNVFSGGTVTLSPPPNPAPTAANLASIVDGALPTTAIPNSWGTCTGPAVSPSIKLSSTTTVIGRTILTTLSSDQTTDTTLSLSINGTVVVAGQTSNFQYYTGTKFYA